MNSYYRCASGGREVCVWPAVTQESGFYDVVVTEADGHAVTTLRITLDEAAAVVLTELGAPLGTTLVSLAGMIRRWREAYDAEYTTALRRPASASWVSIPLDEV